MLNKVFVEPYQGVHSSLPQQINRLCVPWVWLSWALTPLSDGAIRRDAFKTLLKFRGHLFQDRKDILRFHGEGGSWSTGELMELLLCSMLLLDRHHQTRCLTVALGNLAVFFIFPLPLSSPRISANPQVCTVTCLEDTMLLWTHC